MSRVTPRHATSRQTVAEVCRANGISLRLFYVAQEVQRLGVPELLDRVRDGELSMNLAAQICRFDSDEQAAILAEFHNLAPRQRTHMLRLMIESRTAPA
jgi:hypothetical protein